MASTRSFILILVSAVLAAMAAPVGAAPIITFADSFTAHRASGLSSLPAGDFVQIYVDIDAASTLDPLSTLSVVATRGPLSVPLNHFPQWAPIFGPSIYVADTPFAAPDGSWSITATDSTGTSAPVLIPPIANPQLLPFVTDITVSDTGTTPTVSWTLPDLTGFDVDEASFRIIDANTEVHLFTDNLPTATTSFNVPASFLVPGGSYIYAVVLRDTEIIGGFENSSTAFSGVTRVPEPGILTLLLAALAGIGGARRLIHACRIPE
jgi:hypothetical protein